MPTSRSGQGTKRLIPDTKRYAFLRALKSHDDVSVVCRLPECTAAVERSRGQGPTPWFHKPACAKTFRQRRQALDDLIDRLSQELVTGGHTWRERSSLEWEIRWLLGVRSAYVSPTDWIEGRDESVPHSGTDDGSIGTRPQLDALLAAWRAQPSRRSRDDECFVCDGTGTRDALRDLASKEGVPEAAEEEAFRAGFWSFFQSRAFHSVDECFRIGGEVTARRLAGLQAGEESEASVLSRLRPPSSALPPE